MTPSQWSTSTAADLVARRAGGRRRYNAQRRTQQLQRRAAIVMHLYFYGELRRGEQREFCERLGVTKGTLSKDVAWARWFCGPQIGCGVLPKVTVEKGWFRCEWLI